MSMLSKIIIVLGFVALAIGVIARLALVPITIASLPAKPSSFFVLANTLFLIGLVFRK